MTISIGSVVFSGRGEDQIEWPNRYTWQPVGQSNRFALGGNIYSVENPRAGRPIILTAELPWCWILQSTIQALDVLASTPGNHPFVYGSYSSTVIFDRSQGPFQLTPINPLKTHFTGSIYLLEV
jgi:hypothetical protein